VDFGRRFPDHYRCSIVIRGNVGVATTTLEPHQAFEELRTAIRRCIDRGIFRSTDVETTSQVLWATIHRITSLLIVMPRFPWVERERLIDQVIDTAIQGLIETR